MVVFSGVMAAIFGLVALICIIASSTMFGEIFGGIMALGFLLSLILGALYELPGRLARAQIQLPR